MRVSGTWTVRSLSRGRAGRATCSSRCSSSWATRFSGRGICRPRFNASRTRSPAPSSRARTSSSSGRWGSAAGRRAGQATWMRRSLRANARLHVAAGRADQVSAVVGFFLAEAELEAGDPAGCRERILEAGGGPELPLNERLYQPRWYGVLSRAELALGEVDRAEGWVERAEAAAGGLELPGRTGWATHARAGLLLARGEAARAASVALAAVAAFGAAGNRIEAGRSRALHGIALGAAGERGPAIAVLERARAELEECGAYGPRDEAARELRQLGRRVPRRTTAAADGLGSLSPRELEIAQLVHQGQDQQADRRRALPVGAHGRDPPHTRLSQACRDWPHRSRRRHRARAGSRFGLSVRPPPDTGFPRWCPAPSVGHGSPP